MESSEVTWPHGTLEIDMDKAVQKYVQHTQMQACVY